MNISMSTIGSCKQSGARTKTSKKKAPMFKGQIGFSAKMFVLADEALSISSKAHLQAFSKDGSKRTLSAIEQDGVVKIFFKETIRNGILTTFRRNDGSVNEAVKMVELNAKKDKVKADLVK